MFSGDIKIIFGSGAKNIKIPPVNPTNVVIKNNTSFSNTFTMKNSSTKINPVFIDRAYVADRIYGEKVIVFKLKNADIFSFPLMLPLNSARFSMLLHNLEYKDFTIQQINEEIDIKIKGNSGMFEYWYATENKKFTKDQFQNILRQIGNNPLLEIENDK